MDKRSEFKRFDLFYGAKNPSELLFEQDLVHWTGSDDVNYHQIVDKADDGWNGNVGLITNLFTDDVNLEPDTRVIICGPPIMYKFVIAELTKADISEDNVYVDLERRMKCGVGKCGHCQINDKYVCLDGPVFKFSDIKHLEEAV